MKTSHPFSQNLCKKVLLITCIAVLSNGLKVNAQSSSAGGGAGNSYAVLKFLGWGTTSGDLLFKTNNITRMTLQNTTGFLGIGLGPGAPNPNPPSMLSIGTSWQFQVNSTGNLIRINNVQYSFPSAQGAASTFLQNDGAGNLSWSGSSTAWGLTGNAGIIDGTHFIGTTTNVPLNFRVNNQMAGKIDGVSVNTFLGLQAGNSNTIGHHNTAIGSNALIGNTSGFANTAIGSNALSTNNTGLNNTAIGADALYSNSVGIWNTANGARALWANTNGIHNTANGMNALSGNITGQGNTAVGSNALANNTTGSNNTALGFGANVSSLALTNATAIGYNAKVSTSNSLVLGGTGADSVNVGIGTTAPSAKLEVIGAVKITDGTQALGKVLTSDAAGLASWQTSGWSLTGNTGIIDGTDFIGTTTNVPLNFRVNNLKAGRIDPAGPVFLGYQAGNSNTGTNNTGIGYNALFSNTSGNFNTANGNEALYSNTTGNYNTAIGWKALYYNAIGVFNTANGAGALYANTTGQQNTAIGTDALASNNTGNYNTATGRGALFYNVAGNYGVAIGYQSQLYANNQTTSWVNTNTSIGAQSLRGSATAANNTGTDNTAIGVNAIYQNSTGKQNTANGAHALAENTTGNYNTAIGYQALRANLTGSKNTALGHNADVSSDNLTNATAIGYNAKVSTSNSLVLGGTGADAVNVGIGTTAPSSKLDVKGAISGFGIVPVGSIIAWHKSLPGTPALPDGWVECNGQQLFDAGSPYDSLLIPNLNGEGRFLRGSATSGTPQNDQLQSHKHTEPGHQHWVGVSDHGERHTGYYDPWGDYVTSYNQHASNWYGGPYPQPAYTNPVQVQLGDPVDSGTGAGAARSGNETRPINMSVVWIMRIK